MLDAFAEQVGLNESRRSHRCPKHVDAVVLGPDSSTVGVVLVLQKASVGYVVDDEGCIPVSWGLFQVIPPSLPRRWLDIYSVFHRLSPESSLHPRDVYEDVDDLASHLRRGRYLDIIGYGKQSSSAIELNAQLPVNPRYQNIEDGRGRCISLTQPFHA